MKRFTVVFAHDTWDQIAALYRRIASHASPDIAARYTDAVMAQCEALNILPERGSARDDIRHGLRITTYRRRTVIAYLVEADRVVILGVFHGGQAYEASLEPED